MIATKRRIVIQIMLAVVVGVVGVFVMKRGQCRVDDSNGLHERRWLSMGTVARYVGRGSSRHDAANAEIVKAAFDEVEWDLSVFNPESAISKLNEEGYIRLQVCNDPCEFDFLKVVSFAIEVARTTEGAFDPTVNPLMRIWGFRKDTVVVEAPSGEMIDKALAAVGFGKVVISTNENGMAEVRLGNGVELDLGGIAKGYAVDLAYERLKRSGVRDFIIDLGGNIRVDGNPSKDRIFWRIAVRDPADPTKNTGEMIELESGEAVATSGSYERFVEIGGKHYSHIIDPRTGWPVERGGSVTAIAKSAMEADAFSTAGFVAGLESGIIKGKLMDSSRWLSRRAKWENLETRR